MCGLIGIVSAETPDATDYVERGMALLRHRGPDDHGIAVEHNGHVVLGHQRLSIIDLSHAAAQPMRSAGGVVGAYNGEIYNYAEMREELRAKGYSFNTTSDTEVMLAAYLEWGTECVSRFVGMWAISVYDPRSGMVWLSRDPFGIKPLYYSARPGEFAFASELAPLVERSNGVLDAQVAFDFLRWGHVDRSSRTWLADVNSLSPGTHLLINANNGAVVEQRRYWSPPARSRAADAPSYTDAVELLRLEFEESIRLHLRSDVPIGSALSGGVDSSGIVAMMRQVGGPGVQLRTVTYGAERADLNEERFARLAIAAAGTDPILVRIGSADVAEVLPLVEAAQYEPFSSLSILAQYQVFRAASASGLTVMLDGQGADELFGGYPSFLMERLTDLLRRGRLRAAGPLARVVARAYGSGAVARCVARALPAPLATKAWARWLQRTTPRWLDERRFADLGARTTPSPRDLPRTLSESLEFALTTSSLPGLLRYEDRNSMAHSVESRVPYLTTSFASLAAQLPDDYLIGPDGTTKRILRDALKGIVPDEILARRDKIAFSVPEPEWVVALPRDRTLTAPGLVVNTPATDAPWRVIAYQRFLERTGVTVSG